MAVFYVKLFSVTKSVTDVSEIKVVYFSDGKTEK